MKWISSTRSMSFGYWLFVPLCHLPYTRKTRTKYGKWQFYSTIRLSAIFVTLTVSLMSLEYIQMWNKLFDANETQFSFHWFLFFFFCIVKYAITNQSQSLEFPLFFFFFFFILGIFIPFHLFMEFSK